MKIVYLSFGGLVLAGALSAFSTVSARAGMIPEAPTHGVPVEMDNSALPQGLTGIIYLGPNGGSEEARGTSVRTASSDEGLSGTSAFNPGATGDVTDFLLIHGGGGTINYLYAIDHPGLTGVWSTSEALAGPGNQSALSSLDLYGVGLNILGNVGTIPEPASAGLLAVGIAAVGLLGRWRPARGRRIVWNG